LKVDSTKFTLECWRMRFMLNFLLDVFYLAVNNVKYSYVIRPVKMYTYICKYQIGNNNVTRITRVHSACTESTSRVYKEQKQVNKVNKSIKSIK